MNKKSQSKNKKATAKKAVDFKDVDVLFKLRVHKPHLHLTPLGWTPNYFEFQSQVQGVPFSGSVSLTGESLCISINQDYAFTLNCRQIVEYCLQSAYVQRERKIEKIKRNERRKKHART